jgi:hypothetical protein
MLHFRQLQRESQSRGEVAWYAYGLIASFGTRFNGEYLRNGEVPVGATEK